MNRNKSNTSTFLFSNVNDSIKRFGADENGNIYSKSSQPAHDIFQRRTARLYNCKNAVSNHCQIIADILITAVASGNEKIAVHKNCFLPLYNLIMNISEKHSIKVIEFNSEISLHNAVKSGIKAVIMSSSSIECNTVNISTASEICKSFHIPLIIDNTVTTSFIINPFNYGADIVIEFSHLISVGNEKNSYITVIDKNCFNWSYNNNYVKIFPFLKYSYPLTSYLNFKCKKTSASLTKENQAEYYMLCQGLKTLENRMIIHSENCKTVSEILKNYSSQVLFNKFENYNSMFIKAFIDKSHIQNLKSGLSNITVKNICNLYDMYNCTAIYFNDNCIYIRCGTEPSNYIKHLFEII